MEWTLFRKKKPHAVRSYEVTLEDIEGARLLNVAIYRPLENTWHLLIDKDDYEGCKVVAWRERSDVYGGSV